MKLLILIIAVLLMSVFADSLYAQTSPLEPKEIQVTGIDDGELRELKKVEEETKILNENGSEKIELIDSIEDNAIELVPKQIALIQKKENLRGLYEARDKYLLCIQKKNRDCSELEAILEKLIKKEKDLKAEMNETMKTYITNRPVLKKIESCIEVAREVYPNFSAKIKLRIKVDQAGYPDSIEIDNQNSRMSPYFENFPECVAQFARELNFKNPYEDFAKLTQTFVF